MVVSHSWNSSVFGFIKFPCLRAVLVRFMHIFVPSSNTLSHCSHSDHFSIWLSCTMYHTEVLRLSSVTMIINSWFLVTPWSHVVLEFSIAIVFTGFAVVFLFDDLYHLVFLLCLASSANTQFCTIWNKFSKNFNKHKSVICFKYFIVKG